MRGPSAVALLKDHKNPIVQAETNDQIWGLQSEGTTAGDIATSVIAVRVIFLYIQKVNFLIRNGSRAALPSLQTIHFAKTAR